MGFAVIFFGLVSVGMMVFATFFVKDIWNRIGMILLNISFWLFFSIFLGVYADKENREYLKQKYPVLVEAMYQEELEQELNILLKDKQANDERYKEIIKDLK